MTLEVAAGRTGWADYNLRPRLRGVWEIAGKGVAERSDGLEPVNRTKAGMGQDAPEQEKTTPTAA